MAMKIKTITLKWRVMAYRINQIKVLDMSNYSYVINISLYKNSDLK